jgi:hypothetical protein
MELARVTLRGAERKFGSAGEFFRSPPFEQIYWKFRKPLGEGYAFRGKPPNASEQAAINSAFFFPYTGFACRTRYEVTIDCRNSGWPLFPM